MPSICPSCNARFEPVGFFQHECSNCTRQRGSDEEAQRRLDKALANQQEQDREQRERGEAREEEGRWAAMQREEEAAAARELAEERAEERREAALERQKEQLANRWRYEAESKLEQARVMHAAGAHQDALNLANEAASLGMDAFQLRGSIYKALGNTHKQREQLQSQIGFLKIGKGFTDLFSHQKRVLQEILELGGETDPLFNAYFDAAAVWPDFPHSIHSVIDSAGLLGCKAYRQLVLRHVEVVGKETQAELSIKTGFGILPVVLWIPDNASLIASYLKACERWTFFPFELIEWLLIHDWTDLANEIFKRKLAKIATSPANEMLWHVYAIGVELANRNKQDGSWLKKVEAELKGLQYSDAFGQACARTMNSKGLSQTTKKQLRDHAAVACREWIKTLRGVRSRELIAEALKSGKSYAGLRGSAVFSLVSGVATLAILWKSDPLRAFVAGIVVFFVARFIRKRSNARHIAATHLFEQLRLETAKIATMLSLSDAEAKSMLGSSIAPGYGTPTLTDLFATSVMAAVVIGAIFLLESFIAKENLVAGSEWTQPWSAIMDRHPMTAVLEPGPNRQAVLALYNPSVFGKYFNESRAIAELGHCTSSMGAVSCEASISIGRNKAYQGVPARLELNLAKRTGNLQAFPRGEAPLSTLLRGTPSSLVGAPNGLIGSQTTLARMPPPAITQKVQGVAGDPVMPPMPEGRWEGMVNYPGYGSYPAVMQLQTVPARTLAGTMSYPSLHCTASLAFLKKEGNAYWFRESIQDGKGKCFDGGQISISPLSSDTMVWRYFHPGNVGAPLATATFSASRQQADTKSTGTSAQAPVSEPVTMAQEIRTGCKIWKPNFLPNESVHWSGNCTGGYADGQGIAQWYSAGKEILRYEGTFVSGMLQGKGTMTAAGGDRYEGAYRNGKREGRGVYTTATGQRYDGEFKDNKKHGTGTFTDANGVRQQVNFADGQQVN